MSEARSRRRTTGLGARRVVTWSPPWVQGCCRRCCPWPLREPACGRGPGRRAWQRCSWPDACMPHHSGDAARGQTTGQPAGWCLAARLTWPKLPKRPDVEDVMTMLKGERTHGHCGGAVGFGGGGGLGCTAGNRASTLTGRISASSCGAMRRASPGSFHGGGPVACHLTISEIRLRTL